MLKYQKSKINLNKINSNYEFWVIYLTLMTYSYNSLFRMGFG